MKALAPTLRHHQGGKHAVGARHGNQLAVRIHRHFRAHVGIDGADLGEVVGGAHGFHLGQTQNRIGGDVAGVDAPALELDARGVGGRVHVRTERGDLAVTDQQLAAGDHAVADRVEVGAAEHHGLAGRGGRGGRVGGGGRAGGEAEQQRGKNARHQ